MGRFPGLIHFHHLLFSKRLAIAEACLIGLVAALAAVFLKQGVGALGGWRVSVSQVMPAWVALPLIGGVGGWMSGWLIERVAPEASGSGIPQVKAALANVPMTLNVRVALVKLLSSIFALGAGLTLGRQGPTVHLGAALAAQFSRWVPTSPDYHRQLLAAGAAAGLAAGFNAPIAGILFVVEELLQDVSDITLGTAILASFTGAVVSRLLGGNSLNLDLESPAFQTSFSLQEIPLFVVLGALAGVLGALFNRGIFVSLSLNRRYLKVGLPLRIALAGLFSGLVVAFLPTTLRDNAALQEFLVTGEAGWRFTAIAFATKFILTLVAYGSGAPGGLFAPSLILGSALGYLVCTGVSTWPLALGLFPDGLDLGSPTTYALTGMGAFFSAVARGPITAIVIVFEITTDFNLVLPLMVGSVVAYLVAETLDQGSIYERLLEWNGIELSQETPIDGRLSRLRAQDLMQRHVETLTSAMTLDEAIQAFARSHHRGFPVVDQGRLVGIMTQTDLGNATQRQLSGRSPLSELMVPDPITVEPADTLTHVLYLLNRYKISRLPVTDGRKLVGIITRADIIRAESDQLNGQAEPFGPPPAPSYVVYQTRAPATGQGRILVPLFNPQTAPRLLRLAAAIALERHYELECLQVIVVPRSSNPTETVVNTTLSRRLLQQAIRQGQSWRIPVHTQIRVAHDVSQAILETIKERHIDLTLMGWKGKTFTPGRIFGNTVDTIIRQAPCELLLVRLSEDPDFQRWLLPIAGGPNSQQAVQLVPALSTLHPNPEVRLCQIFQPSEAIVSSHTLEQAATFLNRHLNHPVLATSVCANSIPEAIVDLSEHDRCDVIVLGASREGLLQQALKGNIPAAIARQTDCTVILVRCAL